MQKTQHILLESDERAIPERNTARRVHTQFVFSSKLRRRTFELAIIDYYFLSVRIRRKRLLLSEYTVDLRFVDPTLRFARHIAGRWILATLACGALLGGGVSWVNFTTGSWWQPEWLPVYGLLLVLTVCAGVVAVYRTTESLALVSLHGKACVFECVGGLGTWRAIREFSGKLAAHIKLAASARRKSKAEHLRDEMREHFRLKEAGVLPEPEYEASKRRILATHAPA